MPFPSVRRRRGNRAGGIPINACRGSNRPLNAFYNRRRNGKKSSNPGKWVVHVDTGLTQDFLDRQLHVMKPGEPGSTTVFTGSLADHQDFLEELLNDAPVSGVDTTNNVAEKWQRIDEDIPNDYRDCRRYSFVAMLLKVRGGMIRAAEAAKPLRAKPVNLNPKKQTPSSKLSGAGKFCLISGPVARLRPGSG